MSHELFYTSAPRGLRRGSNGYCTVAATRGLPPLLGQQLERLSDYRPPADWVAPLYSWLRTELRALPTPADGVRRPYKGP